MKRTDLLQQADRLDDSPYYADKTLAAWLRQIAQAQPVAWADCQGEPSKHRVYDYTHPLYTLPLED